MVAWLDSKEKEAVELGRQRDDLAKDVSAYTQLMEAFGKNGIQEMVVDQALPEIESIANAKKAFDRALEVAGRNAVITVTGSIYLVGEVIQLLDQARI